MKTKNRIIPVLLCLALVIAAVSALTIKTIADNANHLSISVDEKEVSVGDTVTVTLSAPGAKNVTTLTGGIRFDTEYLKCTGVTKAQGDSPLLQESEDAATFRMVLVSSKDEANAAGQVGFASVGTNAVSYTATDLVVVTFEVLQAGNIDLVAYESSYDGGNFKDLQTITITAKESAVNVVAKTGTVNINYTVSGQVVTVTHDIACKVGYWDAATSKYVAISAVKVSDNKYSFTAPAGVTEVLLVVKGDVTLDGKFNAGDRMALSKSLLPANNSLKTPLTAEQTFAADVNTAVGVNAGDRMTISKALLPANNSLKTPLAW